ncbi:MAG: hypothetical protein ACI8P9_000311 [Parasphingorhabdus sp.]|jgi:hypothetical protein
MSVPPTISNLNNGEASNVKNIALLLVFLFAVPISASAGIYSTVNDAVSLVATGDDIP